MGRDLYTAYMKGQRKERYFTHDLKREHIEKHRSKQLMLCRLFAVMAGQYNDTSAECSYLWTG